MTECLGAGFGESRGWAAQAEAQCYCWPAAGWPPEMTGEKAGSAAGSVCCFPCGTRGFGIVTDYLKAGQAESHGQHFQPAKRQRLTLPQMLEEPANTRVAGGEAVPLDQILIDPLAGQSLLNLRLNDHPKRLTEALGTGTCAFTRQSSRRRPGDRVQDRFRPENRLWGWLQPGDRVRGWF